MSGLPVTLRAYDGPADRRVLQGLASRLWPRGLHPGGLGWADAIDQLATVIVIAEDAAGEPVGWAGTEGGELILQVDPAAPQAAPALLEWSREAAPGETLTVAVADADPDLAAAVTAAGFEPGGEPEHLIGPVFGMFLPAAPRTPVLPDGYRVRSVAPGESAARVEAHRAAWRPADLPLLPDDAVPGAEATSRFTAAHYELVRATWLYDEALDLVVEAPDGSLAACCIVWWDPAIGVAEIEPLGVTPAHRRRGLASAMTHEAAAQVAARGGTHVLVNGGFLESYPAPASTYLAAGFEIVARGTAYQRAG